VTVIEGEPLRAGWTFGWLALLVLALAVTVAPGCALKRIAINSVANSLAESGDTFASDPDPELIRTAVPFSLKLVESLLAEVPKHRGLLLTACSGFTQYAYAFVDNDAEMLKLDDYTRHAKLQERARKMYLRGRDYCLRSLELGHPGIIDRLNIAPEQAVAVLQKKDVPLMYWTGAAWGKAVALSLDRPALAGDLPIVQALVRRALVLDESFDSGAIHEVMITLEAMPEDVGGSRDRARQHYERALALTKGSAAGPHVSYAMGVLLPQQKRDEFVTLLNKALDVDADRVPKLRLANILTQQYAQYLLDHLEELFISDKEEAHDHQNSHRRRAGSAGGRSGRR
jgi:predicted anti-sigma-YlaC factor YlaD